MDKKQLRFAAISALSLCSASALAVPFNSFDPRSMAMGGAGVAVANPSTAPLFNPALLSVEDEAKKYSIELPIIGVRAYDPGNLRSSTLQDDIDALNLSINAANTGGTAALPANMAAVAGNVSKLNNSLKAVDNQPVQGEFGAATVIGVPGKNVGFAFYADAWGAAGGILTYKDATNLTTFSSEASALSTCTLATTADITTCLNNAGITNPTYINTTTGTVTFDPNTSLLSTVEVRGVVIGEVGLSISHEFTTYDHSWSLGVTPKIMKLQLIDAVLDAKGSNQNGMTGDDYLAKYDAFNFDLGVAKNYGNSWRTGFVVKNVIPQTYDFKRAPAAGATPVPTGATLNLKPQMRVGVSHENTWSTVALDVDLTQNDPAGLEQKSQYVALGGELNAWGWAQLRAGYRADLVNSERNVMSVGLGIAPRIPFFKFHTDLAVAGNANEIGASAQFGFNF